jgi:DNA-binding protein H-NS
VIHRVDGLKLMNLFSANFLDIEVLKRKKQKIELEIAQDEKNKEIISAQIRALQEKQEEIDNQVAKKKITYAKISDTLEQSDLGLSKIIDSLQVLLSFAASKTDTEASD